MNYLVYNKEMNQNTKTKWIRFFEHSKTTLNDIQSISIVPGIPDLSTVRNKTKSKLLLRKSSITRTSHRQLDAITSNSACR